MKTTAVSPADLAASVLSVPPLARRADLAIDQAQNARLLDHLRGGGVRTFMYGGNANLYNMGVTELRALADMLIALARDGDWMIPSVGSDYGKARDQLTMLRDYPFPTAMVLPNRFPSTPAGIATGYRKLADAYGKPVIAYVKDDGFVEAADLGRLALDGAICAIKYAVVRDEPKTDPLPRRAARLRRPQHGDQRHRRAAGHRSSHQIRPAGLHLGQRVRRARPVDGAVARHQARRSRRSRAVARAVHSARGFARQATRRCACCTRRCGSPAFAIPARCCRSSPISRTRRLSRRSSRRRARCLRPSAAPPRGRLKISRPAPAARGGSACPSFRFASPARRRFP